MARSGGSELLQQFPVAGMELTATHDLTESGSASGVEQVLVNVRAIGDSLPTDAFRDLAGQLLRLQSRGTQIDKEPPVRGVIQQRHGLSKVGNAAEGQSQSCGSSTQGTGQHQIGTDQHDEGRDIFTGG